MRLWTLAPKYLDTKGLVALWREGLLAKQVLEGKTVGYRQHPQLIRFRESADALALLNNYLFEVWEESVSRSYNFDREKIEPVDSTLTIPVTTGQIGYEWEHLKRKLAQRDQVRLEQLADVSEPEVFSLFHQVPGEVEAWEVSSQ